MTQTTEQQAKPKLESLYARGIRDDLERAESGYEKAKERFLKDAEGNPANAIGWAESMIRAQVVHELAESIRSYYEQVCEKAGISPVRSIAHPEHQLDDRDHALATAARSVLDSYGRRIMSGSYLPTSSSALSNAVDVYTHRGLSDAMDTLRYAVEAYFRARSEREAEEAEAEALREAAGQPGDLVEYLAEEYAQAEQANEAARRNLETLPKSSNKRRNESNTIERGDGRRMQLRRFARKLGLGDAMEERAAAIVRRDS